MTCLNGSLCISLQHRHKYNSSDNTQYNNIISFRFSRSTRPRLNVYYYNRIGTTYSIHIYIYILCVLDVEWMLAGGKSKRFITRNDDTDNNAPNIIILFSHRRRWTNESFRYCYCFGEKKMYPRTRVFMQLL